MKKRQKIIVGVASGIAIVGLGTGYYLMNTPKGIFLSRLNATQKLTKVSQEFQFSVNAKESLASSFIDGLRVQGHSNLNDQHADVSLSLSSNNPILNFSDLHLIVKGQDIFVNADALASYYSQMAGISITENLSQKYINLTEFSEEQSAAKSDYQFNPKLQKEANDAVAKYLVNLKSDRFKKKGNKAVLTLHKADLKELLKTVIDAYIKSKHYDGDKEDLKELKANIDESFDNYLSDSQLDLVISQGKEAGNAAISVKYQSDSWGDINVDLTSTVTDYQPPKEPTQIIKSDDLSKIFQEATEKKYAELYQTSEIND